MLRFLRQSATSWLIKIILGAIVIVFVFWGVGSFRSQRKDRVALVNGETITSKEYGEAYNNIIERLRQRLGNNLNDDMIKMLDVKSQALNMLIDKKLMFQEAAKLNLRVTNDELADTIRQIEAFQTNGNFDSQIYKNVLNQNRLTPEEFEFIQKESIIIEKIRSFILSNVKVSEQEAIEWFKWENTSVNVDFVLFEPGRYDDINPTSDEISSFFENHKESYKADAMIKVRFLRFDPDAYSSVVKITNEEIQDYYESNIEKFKTQKTVEARHILIKLDQSSNPETVEKKRKTALDILKLAREGIDFAELAKQYSEGPSKDRGGYLGEFKKNAMVKPFAEKAFQMKAGEISEPVRTQYGWHIIKVEKVNEETGVSFKDAEDKIRKKLVEERAKNLAYEEAEAVYDASFEGDDLTKNAEARGLDIVTTDFFTKNSGPNTGIKNRSAFASYAFNLSLMEIGDIQDFEDGYYIIQLIEKIPEKIPELKDVEEKVRIDLIKQMRDEKANKDANELLVALKDNKSPEDTKWDTECKKLNLTATATGFFKRNSSIPYIGFDQNISQAAFKLSNENMLPEAPVKGKKGYYIIKFRDRKEPGLNGFEEEKEKIKEKLLKQKMLKTFDAWLSSIRNKSVISIEKSFWE
ncbi:MAG: peptidyl-prolyl cis-trans isomerase [Desulfobacterales bacterium]|jgi:peptidyl-prolyl cis-trans isomerase D|nr:peptidyl-prolyl cis-trans isomerase [Desulfobacterales bacterium]